MNKRLNTIWGISIAALLGGSFAPRAYADPPVVPSPVVIDKPFVASVFTDNMVLQRDLADPVWGWTTPGATVAVTIAGKTATTVANASGAYLVKLPRFSAGGPYTLGVSGPQSATFNNVMFGDVWICSGQSNMEFGIMNGFDATDEVAAANYPDIRVFVAEKKYTLDPQVKTNGSWLPCSPDTIKRGTWGGFSGVGYFFGRELYKNLKVPIGLIQTSWGGTPAEAWTSEATLAEKIPIRGQLALLDARRDGEKQGLTATSTPPLPAFTLNQNSPSALYNGMLAPLIPYGIKGAIWYQGESNAGRARMYRALLPAMITDWRTAWGEGDFAFYIVQLAGWAPGGTSWPDLREAQWMTAQTLRNTGIVAAYDIGDKDDIHPKNKQEVGRRLALAAEAKTYSEKVDYTGPVYKAAKVEESSIRVSFAPLGGGLVAKNSAVLAGFTIAGTDMRFVPADAKIDGDTVVVSAATVPSPIAVRYAWLGYTDANLFGANGLPAFPFRTDPDQVPKNLDLPANVGPNLAEGVTVVASDKNPWNWDTGLVDGSWDSGCPTTWASGDVNSFPKTATIDLSKLTTISLVAFGVPNFGSTKTVNVSISTDGQTFSNVGSYVFSLRKEEKHILTIPPTSTRYVRLTYPDHYAEAVNYPPTFMFTTELEVHGPK